MRRTRKMSPEATRQILDASPQTEVLVTTLFHSVEMAQQAFQAGARAYVLESDGVPSLVAAIATLSRHKPFLTGQLAEEALDSYMRQHQISEADEAAHPEESRLANARSSRCSARATATRKPRCS